MARKDIENAKIALKYRLYSQPNYHLIDALRETIEEDSWKVVLHYDECGTPVGCAVRNKRNHMIQVFVRKACRGKGIGSILVNQLKTKSLGVVDQVLATVKFSITMESESELGKW